MFFYYFPAEELYMTQTAVFWEVILRYLVGQIYLNLEDESSMFLRNKHICLKVDMVPQLRKQKYEKQLPCEFKNFDDDDDDEEEEEW